MDCESVGWQQRKSRAWNPERADILWLAVSAAYVWTLSIGAKVCLSPKIHRAAVCKNVNGVNVFRRGLPPFQNRLWNRRRIPRALKLTTGLRAAKKVQGGKPVKREGGAAGCCSYLISGSGLGFNRLDSRFRGNDKGRRSGMTAAEGENGRGENRRLAALIPHFSLFSLTKPSA